jgi:hypothetical protein
VDFATTILSIKAQIICNHFTDETLVQISGAMQLSDQDKQFIPQAIALLRDQASKNFRIEVTSDSMIYQDEQQEKQDRVAFLAAVGQYLQMAMPAAQAAPELVPMLVEMLKFGVTAFKAGKQLEGIIDETADKLRETAKMQAQQPPQPPVELQKVQMEQQAKQQQMQVQMQIDQQKMQMQMELEKAKQEYQAQENQLKFQLEEQRNAMDREMEMRSEQAKMEMELKVAQMKMMTERNTQVLLAHINNGAKIEVARIGSDDSDGAMAYANEQDMAQAMQNPMETVANAINNNSNQMAIMLGEMMNKMSQPKTVIRGPDGKIQGVQ